MSLTISDFKNVDLWHIYEATLNGGGGGGGAGSEFALYQDKVEPPAAFVQIPANTWTTRDLTEIKAVDWCILSSNVMILQEGSYIFEGYTWLHRTNFSGNRLYDITNSQAVAYGTQSDFDYRTQLNGIMPFSCYIENVAENTEFQLDDYATRQGWKQSGAYAGQSFVVFAEVKIIKLS